MKPILQDAITVTFRDADVATVEQALPAHLLLVRGLAEAKPKDAELAALAAQLYFSYALAFVEDRDPERAALLYAEGRRLGQRTLERRGWFREAESSSAPTPEQLRDVSRDDVPLLVWTLANWAGWIGRKLDDPAAVAELPRVEAYLARALEVDGGFFLGMPHALAGSIKCLRPTLFGGDPEAGKAHFDQAFRISGNRLLLFDVLYAQYYCQQTLNQEEFHKTLEAVENAPSDLLPEYRLLNEVAKQKALRLMEREHEIF